jgi:PucR-like helix-turn-helix protein
MTAAQVLPPETVAFVLSELDEIVAEIVSAVREASPVYGEVLSAPEGMGLRLGVEQAIRAFLEAIGRGERVGGRRSETDELWRRLGEAEFQAGRGLDELRLAFRAGTRAAWRSAAEVAVRADISAPAAIALAEAIFVYGDDLASDVVEGYLRMQSDEAGERERRRRRLAVVLLDPAGYDADAVARAGELARWTVPRELVAVALATETPGSLLGRLDADVLVGADGQGAWLLVPDPDGPGRRAATDRALEGAEAAVGLTVAPAHARRSLEWARLTLQLVGARADGPLRTVDHLSTVILLQDRELARTFSDTRLAVLRGLPTGERERLTQTLSAWLAHQRHTPEIARRLHVHPQTVRYRVAKLRELLGESIDSPEGRFELALALRIDAALGGSRVPNQGH